MKRIIALALACALAVSSSNPSSAAIDGQNVPGNVPLPPGAATAALQSSILSALNTIIGQAITACSAPPVVSATNATSGLILKASAGSLCGAYATNYTSKQLLLIAVDSASIPADGAVTPKACVELPPSGTGGINFGLGFSSTYSAGISVFMSSGADCFTKTTTGLTGFFAGQVI